jgi:hypothetical protein
MSGNFVALKTFSYTNEEIAINGYNKKIQIGNDGIYLCGDYIGDLSTTYPGLTNVNTTQTGFIVKLNFSGGCIWAKQIYFSAVAYSNTFQMQVIENSTAAINGIYITGIYEGSLSPYLPTSGDWSNAYVMKFDLTGTFVWARRIDGAYKDVGAGIAVNNNGVFVALNIYESASTTVYMPNNTVLRTITGLSTVNRNTVVIGFSHDGTLLTTPNIVIPTLGYDSVVKDIAVYNNNIYICGTYQGSYTTPTYPFTFSSPSYYCGLLLKYDLSGNFIYKKEIKANSAVVINCVRATVDGIYVSGYYDGSITSESDLVNVLSTSTGSTGFLVKYNNDATLSLAWAKRFEMSSVNEYGMGLSVSSNSVYISLRYQYTGTPLREYYKVGSAGTVFTRDILSVSSSYDASVYIKYDLSGNYMYSQKSFDSSYSDMPGAIDGANGVVAQGAIQNWWGGVNVTYNVSIYSENRVGVSASSDIPNGVLFTINNAGDTYTIYKNSIAPSNIIITTNTSTYLTSYVGLVKFIVVFTSYTTETVYYGLPIASGETSSMDLGRVDLSFNIGPAQSYDLYANGVLAASGLTSTTYTDLSASDGTSTYYIIATLDSRPFTSNTVSVTSMKPTFTLVKTSNLGEALISNITPQAQYYSVYRNNALIKSNILTNSYLDISAGETNTYYITATTAAGKSYASGSNSITLINPSVSSKKSNILGAIDISAVYYNGAYYAVYRNSELIASNITSASYTDLSANENDNRYYIAATSRGGVQFKSFTTVSVIPYAKITAIQNISGDTLFEQYTTNLSIDMVEGGISPYTYKWYYSESGSEYQIIEDQSENRLTVANDISFSGADLVKIYKGVVLDSINNSLDFIYTITFKAFLNLDLTATDNVVQPLNKTTISASVTGGKEPYSFEWYEGDTLLENTTQSIEIENNYTSLTTKEYKCIVRNS